MAYLVRVVEIQQPALAFVDVLVTRIGAINDQGRVHVDVVASEIERNQALENDGPPRKGRREEDEEARRSATIRDHVENSTESSRLIKCASSIAIESIEQARHTVEERAGSWVKRHVIERGEGEDDTEIT